MPRTLHPCSACGKIFLSEAVLQNHFTIEHIPKAFQCSLCPQKFPTLSTLSRHVNAHLRNFHSCIICNEVCTTLFQLYTHLTVFHKDHGTSACNLCKRKFVKIENLRLHYKKKHSNSLQYLEQKAELFCAIHSYNVFPDPALSLDSVINEGTNSDHSEAVENVASDKLELKHGASYVCSKLSDLLLKDEGVAAQDNVTVVQNLPVHPKEGTRPTMVEVCQPEYIGVTSLYSKVPLRKLDVLDPARELNKTDPKQFASCPYQFVFDKQINTQPTSIPDNSNVFGNEEEFVEGRRVYICNVCGIQFDDLDSLNIAHRPVDSYFEIGKRAFTIK